MFIGGYKSGADTAASVSFGRASDTATGTNLPSGYTEKNHPDPRVPAKQLLLPQSGGEQRIGAFYCQADNGRIREKIVTTIMSKNSKHNLLFVFS